MNKNEFLKVFGERARILRLTQRITQKELSQMSGVSAVTISSYENKNATKMPSALTVVRIAQALGVSLDYLCGIDEKEKTAGAATPNGQDKNISTQIIAEPIEIVNMSPDEIVAAAR